MFTCAEVEDDAFCVWGDEARFIRAAPMITALTEREPDVGHANAREGGGIKKQPG
jgi:hypothetical protein